MTNEDLEDLVGKLKKETEAKNEEIKWLKTLVSHRENQIRSKVFSPSEKKTDFPRIAFITTIAMVAVAGLFAAYSLFFNDNERERSANTDSPATLADRAGAYTDSAKLANERDLEKIKNNQIKIDSMMRVKSLESDSARKKEETRSEPVKKPDPQPVKKSTPQPARETAAAKPQKRKPDPKPVQNKKEINTEQTASPEVEDEPPIVKKDKYALAVNKAYFYNKPDVTAKAPAVLLNSSNVELTAIEDINGFIRVSFFNTQGTITEGWLRKQDLRKLY